MESRRYLVDIDTASMPRMTVDCAVVGAGIAGLRAAIEAAEGCDVAVFCKGGVEDSNTWHAQGGIASVLDPGDAFESHIADTIKTGCGLCDEPTVEMVIRQGPGLIRELADWGTEFDTSGGRLETTIEGGHSHRRIAHAHGDETGRAIASVLIEKAGKSPRIRIVENFHAIDILTGPTGGCLGLIGHNGKEITAVRAAATILASGGAGQLYRETTNPACATGDGIAMAWRAGAVLRDLEFVQFHPTTLYVAGASRALITETLRGEGAFLVDSAGQRFMKDYHPDADLAPRDVVSRAILKQMVKTGSTHVYLDVRDMDKRYFARRFPLINELCESFDIDVSRDLIPVRPSAHYMIGGIRTNTAAAASLNGLFACGEAASTGLHGANRLGSNSLLEGLVFGRIAGESARRFAGGGSETPWQRITYTAPKSNFTRLDTTDVRNSLKALMWRNVGITRSARSLRHAVDVISFWQRYVMDKVFDSPAGWECQNMLTAARLMAESALNRRESRGVHFRSDHPKASGKFAGHTEIHR